jgi:hypothetical protein
MENQVQAMDDKQAELSQEKQPYATPRLMKLGNVEQLTQGMPLAPGPDDTVLSI